ncbi:MAG: hypothetical protein IPN60_20910 [Saprospiraceae bacterium]|nr:hypothetical protein [Candidatus Opimibacter skivensis]
MGQKEPERTMDPIALQIPWLAAADTGSSVSLTGMHIFIPSSIHTGSATQISNHVLTAEFY